LASADITAYYNFLDRFDLHGVGTDIPLADPASALEGLRALVDGTFIDLRPRARIPMVSTRRASTAASDDPKGGWTGRGHLDDLRETRAPVHVEGGKGTTSNAGGSSK
jgi:hypothetical protein